MAYGKPMKKNFYTEGRGEIAMPAEGEMSPVLADTPELFSQSQSQPSYPQSQTNHPMLQHHPEPEPEYAQESYDSANDQSEDDQEMQEVAQITQQAPKVKQDHPNFKALREAAERAQWERDALKAQMLEMQRAMQMGNVSSMQKQQVAEPEIESDDFDFEVADDALLEGKDAKKLVQELKKVKQQLKQFGSRSQETAIEAKIKATYPDFDSVVSVENVQRLNQEYPEIAKTLRDTPDLYNKASAAYAIMKKFGIYKDMSYEEDKMKAIKNAQKPRPIASVSPQQGDSPLSKANAFANGLNKDLQKQLLAEMQAARKAL